MEPLASIGRTTLYAMDVIDFLKGYEGRRFGLTITSPPYNLGKEYGENHDSWETADYLDWVEYWGRLLYEQTEEHGRLCLNIPLDVNLGGKRFFPAEVHASMLAAGWEFQASIAWDKIVGSSGTAWGSWLSASAPNVIMPVELVLVYNREGWKRGRNGRTTDIAPREFLDWWNQVWRFPGARRKKDGHPAPFPPELPRRLMKLFGFAEDLHCDPFVGTGTTCEVAELLGRESVGVDNHPPYLTDEAIPRITAARDIRLGSLTDSEGQRWENLPLDSAAS